MHTTLQDLQTQIQRLYPQAKLTEESLIWRHLLPCIEEHGAILEAILQSPYILTEVHFREILREYGQTIDFLDEELFYTTYYAPGTELLPVLTFEHAGTQSLDGPGSLVRVELSHHSMSGMR